MHIGTLELTQGQGYAVSDSSSASLATSVKAAEDTC